MESKKGEKMKIREPAYERSIWSMCLMCLLCGDWWMLLHQLPNIACRIIFSRIVCIPTHMSVNFYERASERMDEWMPRSHSILPHLLKMRQVFDMRMIIKTSPITDDIGCAQRTPTAIVESWNSTTFLRCIVSSFRALPLPFFSHILHFTHHIST